MYSYNAYGLKIQSEVALPQLSHSPFPLRSPDIFITIKRSSNGYVEPETGYSCMWKISREKAVLTIKNLATYNIRKGREIAICPAASFDGNFNQLIAISSLLAIILYQRNTLTLHASCVQIEGSAVAFLGNSGSGKSLLAGALCARGHRLINDDIVPVHIFDRNAIAYPGYPMIKMKPCEATLLGLSKGRSTTLHENEKKHAYSFRYNYSNRPVSLKCILTLDIGKERRIKRLCARDSFIALLKNSPPVIWNILPDGRHFDNVGEFINKIPVFLLTREPRLNTLQDHAKMIEKFLRNGRNPTEIKNGKNS